MACSMEKEICGPLGSFITNRSVQLSINRQHRTDLNEILEKSHDIVKEVSWDFVFQLIKIRYNKIISVR